MFTGSAKELTDLSRRFTEPANATHRQYEALRAYFVEGLPGVEAARRFGYTPGSFRVLVHQFRRDPQRAFFVPPAKGPHAAPKADPLRDRIIALQAEPLHLRHQPGPARRGAPAWPRRRRPGPQGRRLRPPPPAADEERPPGPRPTPADVADVRQLDLTPRQLRTRFGGLFLFLPTLASIPFDRIIRQAGCPAPAWSRRAAPSAPCWH